MDHLVAHPEDHDAHAVDVLHLPGSEVPPGDPRVFAEHQAPEVEVVGGADDVALVAHGLALGPRPQRDPD